MNVVPDGSRLSLGPLTPYTELLPELPSLRLLYQHRYKHIIYNGLKMAVMILK
jgi:hypothetical protein